MTRYNSKIVEMSKVAMLLALTIASSIFTSTWSPFPKMPFFNARPDIWFGVAFISLFFINWKYRPLFVIALAISLIPSEMEYGWVSYGLEYVCPMTVMLLMIVNFKKFWINFSWMAFVFILYFGARLFFHTYSGVLIWGFDWKASSLYNIYNVLIDGLFSLPLLLVATVKLTKRLS